MTIGCPAFYKEVNRAWFDQSFQNMLFIFALISRLKAFILLTFISKLQKKSNNIM